MPQAVSLGSWDLGWDRALALALEYAQLLDSPAPPAGHLWSRACPSWAAAWDPVTRSLLQKQARGREP